MQVIEAIISRRTKRKFLNKKVESEKLKYIIECARFTPTGANLQALKYAIIEREDLVNEIFPLTKWSGYHPEDAPDESQQPPSYIAILGDKNIKPGGDFETDAGAAGTIILLAAEEMELSACWLGAISRKEISEVLGLDENLSLLYLIALGYSDQKSRVVLQKDGIKYYTDEDGVLNVPKRSLDEILINI